MMKLLMTAVACTLIAAAPAGAAEAEADRGATSAGKAASEQPRQEAASRKTKYCVTVQPDVGSRIPTRECRTKADWLAGGVDIDNRKPAAGSM